MSENQTLFANYTEALVLLCWLQFRLDAASKVYMNLLDIYNLENEIKKQAKIVNDLKAKLEIILC